MMQVQLELRCDDHLDMSECPDSLVVRDVDGRFGLRIHDGGTARMRIRYCPWCGAKLKKYADREIRTS
jgi:hypothetical protein